MQLMTQETFSTEQINLIKSQIAKDATADELKLFLYQCQRTGLDPLTRQIYFVKRGGRMTIQTSIDGFRVIAERSGLYAGQDEPQFTYTESGELLKCAVTVFKFSPTGQRYPAGTGVAFYKEYYPNPMNLQKSLAHTMIAKVAEALALRKAFPQDLSGLYTSDEMHQATPQAPTEEQKEELIAMLPDLTMEDDKKQQAYEMIKSCGDVATLSKIKVRLNSYK
jgi:phage recombination protein Bet